MLPFTHSFTHRLYEYSKTYAWQHEHPNIAVENYEVRHC